MVSKATRKKLVNYKSDIITILSDKREKLKQYEVDTLHEFYSLIELVLLNNLKNKWYSTEDIIKARTLSYAIILSATDNDKIKKLIEKMNIGLI